MSLYSRRKSHKLGNSDTLKDRFIEPATLSPTYAGEGFSGPHKHVYSDKKHTTTSIDRRLHAMLGRLTNGLSPAALNLAMHDWWIHLLIYPGQQMDLVKQAWEKELMFLHYATCQQMDSSVTPCIAPRTSDTRFSTEAWNLWPYNVYSQGFLLVEAWWQEATTSVRGVMHHHRDFLAFITRQLTDMGSPSNFPLSNPEVLRTTIRMHGTNFVLGALYWTEDILRQQLGKRPAGAEKFQVGKDVAITPGKVIYRNSLIELIQYEPQTRDVYAEPILIVPAWIMKYYILDLSSYNSLVSYLIGHGHTVFMISWKNPDARYRDYGMESYMNLGIMDALSAISRIIPNRPIHAAGYCIGGTLLAMASAVLARENKQTLASITIFATQVDFEEAGELLLFIDESQITYLEDIMSEQGYLDSHQMSGAFNLLRSKDLIWSRMVEEYLKGKRQPMFDLMAWNSDSTRLPYRMHSEYLRNFFLNNDLTEGRYQVEGKKIALTDIHAPIFAVSTQKDHIAPWKSVHKIHLFTDTEITFVLTNGGHNAGIVSEPGHKNRSFQIKTTENTDHYLAPEDWQKTVPVQEGSWWPAWNAWLNAHSSEKVTPPPMGALEKGLPVLGDAPGTYVYER